MELGENPAVGDRTLPERMTRMVTHGEASVTFERRRGRKCCIDASSSIVRALLGRNAE